MKKYGIRSIMALGFTALILGAASSSTQAIEKPKLPKKEQVTEQAQKAQTQVQEHSEEAQKKVTPPAVPNAVQNAAQKAKDVKIPSLKLRK